MNGMHISRKRGLLVVAVFYCIALIQDVSATFTMTLETQSKECFVVRLPAAPTMVSGNYDILSEDIEGDMLTVWLENQSISPTKKLWKSSEEESEAIFSVTVMEPNQRLALCFRAEWDQAGDDYVASIREVEIGFGLQVHPMPRTLPDEENGPDAQRALDLIQSAISVETDWSNLMDHFSFLRSREATHIKLTSEILDRIMGWTIVEAFVVIFMAVGQVLYWKKFFEQKRYL